MRTLQNQMKALTIASIMAAVLIIHAAPAAADQKVMVNVGGSKVCIILSGVVQNVPDHVASVLGAVLEAIGC